jgi:6,7-dimethyl-8-ribityllumazine synthase
MEESMTAKTVEGGLVVPDGARFAIVASRFNHFVVDRLVEGALDALVRHGACLQNIVVVRVPGAWELPFATRRLAMGGKVSAVIALGAVIRGSTSHFDYIAGEASKGLAAAAHAAPVPVAFGVLTTESLEQAIERAGAKHGNKGWDAAVSAIEMITLSRALDIAGL